MSRSFETHQSFYLSVLGISFESILWGMVAEIMRKERRKFFFIALAGKETQNHAIRRFYVKFRNEKNNCNNE